MTIRNAKYGWLAPNGTFYESEWGTHQAWAWEYWLHTAEDPWGCKIPVDAGDLLLECGWVLIHSPAMDEPVVTQSNTKNLTKAQSEFLFDYFRNLGLETKAMQYVR